MAILPLLACPTPPRPPGPHLLLLLPPAAPQASVEAANLSSAMALERRVRLLCGCGLLEQRLPSGRLSVDVRVHCSVLPWLLPSLLPQVRELEGVVAAAGADAAAGRAAAKQAHAALAALEWRVDKVGRGMPPASASPPPPTLLGWKLLRKARGCCRRQARAPHNEPAALPGHPFHLHSAPLAPQSSNATIGTLKALEARQDKLRSEVHAVAGTATLAGARADALAAEVARLQRRVHGSGGSPLPPGSGGKQAWRLY